MDGNDRAIAGLVTVAHAMVHVYELSIPIFVTIWLTEFTTTAATLGVLVTVGMAFFGIGALPGGVLADHYSAKRLIRYCLVGMAGSFLVLGVAPSLFGVALALALWGLAASVYHPAGLSLISNGVTERGRAFAYHGMAGNLGIALGPFATALLLVRFEWRTVALVLAAPALLAAVVATRVDVDEYAATDADAQARDADRPTSLREFGATTTRLFSGAFALVFLVVVCSGLYYRGVLTFLPDLLAGLPALRAVTLGDLGTPARYLYAALLMVGVAGQYVGGRLTDVVAPSRGLVAAFAALAVIALAFMPLASAGTVPLLLASALLGFLLFLVQPFYQAAVAETTPSGARGVSYGYTYLGAFGVGALGATVAGTILTYGTPTVLFAALAGFAVVAAGAALVLATR
ncbi:MFS transporter [Halarchaeum sp. P4]|uniref:MFS transporter n=1 Tax=Halarchaeum sp. P4 TaxID=3421639 RepID=UPI003EC0C8E8